MLTVYKSSAGSGKTYTLVKEYLRICLSHPSKFSKILAITFTNKASAEMKERIITCIHQFINKGSNKIIDELIKEGKLDGEKVRKNCEILVDLILHSYSNFSVMTIDSFISRVVRTFAYDLDMPLKFEVELDTDYLFLEIIEKLLAGAEKDNFVGDILTQFALSKIYSSGSWFLDNELKKIGKVTFNEKYLEPVFTISADEYDDIFWKELIGELEQSVSIFRKRVNSLAKKAMEIIKENGLTIDDFFQKKRGPAGALDGYQYASTPKDFKTKQRLQTGKWVTEKCEQENPEKFARIQQALEQGVSSCAREIIQYIEHNKVFFNSNYLVLKNIYSEALIKKFLDLTTAFKKETHKIPLLDFSIKVAKVITKESVPFLYWRLGDTYRHIMIDEFQDTSFLQWINLLPLIEESLSTGKFNMVVGDGKQAIYRWRAGDVRIMEQEIKKSFTKNLKTQVLENNYRSAREIVCFNNTFFPKVKKILGMEQDELFGSVYSEQFVKQNPVIARKGYIKIVDLLSEDTNKNNMTQIKLQMLAQEIQNICDEQNGYNYGDMAVLVRKNKECDLVAQYLTEKGVPIMSPDSLILKTSSTVRFVIAVLKYVTQDDLIALFTIWIFRGYSALEFLPVNSIDFEVSNLEQKISTEFADKKTMLYHLPIYEAVEEIIRIFAIAENNPVYLQGLLEVVFDYSEKFNTDIQSFLKWWDQYSDSEKATLPVAEHKNAVRISTIHKAKGLEFPLVFVPFNWKLFETASGFKQHIIWVKSDKVGKKIKDFPFLVDVQKDMEYSLFQKEYKEEKKLSILDSVNLLYVAFTRAQDRLYIYYKTANKTAINNTSDLIEQSIKDMDLGKHTDGWIKGKQEDKERLEDEFHPEILEHFPTHSWRHKITVRRRSPELWKLVDTERIRKVEKGVLMHSILSEIKTTADIDQAVENKYWEGQISRQEMIKIREDIHALMKLEYSRGKVSDWFHPHLKIMNEKTIITEGQEFRPDKVIVDKEKVIIIEYKTGLKEKEHKLQMEKYSTLLENMGYKKIEKYVLYLQTGVIEEL